MVVFCPSCGSKISVEPARPGGNVECPRCKSTFATAGLKSAADAPPPKRFRPKNPNRRKLGGVLIVTALLLIFGGAAAGLYYSGLFRSRSSNTTIGGTGSGSDSSTRPGWKYFESSEAHVRGIFPGEPRRHVRPTKDVEFRLEKDGVAYGIVFADLDQAHVQNKTPEQIIQQQHDQWAVGNKGKLVSEKEVTAGVYKGKEFVVELPSGKAYMRYFAAGRRLYTVIAIGKAGPPNPADVTAFLDAFAITG
jgi:hypothetical protein